MADARQFLLMWVVAGLALLFSVPAGATSVKALGLAEMTGQADRIFYGQCLETEEDLDENGIPSTYVRFQVSRGVKGVSTGDEILVKFHGVQERAMHVGEGERVVVPMRTAGLSSKAYRVGDDYLLFLYPESRLGFTSPIGAGQGRFEVLSDRSAVNPLGNRFLKDALHPTGGGAISLDRLINDVEALVVHGK